MAARLALASFCRAQRTIPLKEPKIFVRDINFWQVFSKEAVAARRKELNNDLRRSYFDEFREMKENSGKLHETPSKLVTSYAAQVFPTLDTTDVDGESCILPPRADNLRASLVCCLFRASGQEMITTWVTPFSKAFGDRTDINVYQLSLVESWLMSLPGLRGVLLNGGRTAQSAAQSGGMPEADVNRSDLQSPAEGAVQAEEDETSMRLPTKVHFAFGPTDEIRASLKMSNRLTAYIFLLDEFGKVRWRATGNADDIESGYLIKCTQELLEGSKS
ncbi:hypothetical protein CYMTET_52614 [Cymbomonas tetramitiformis]|uniref:Uncharacterized protein n=1 Tax=Cymbomonas tetramitiformis TaxID=36881 RepID=A0AAE0ER60_9CHLO|nr:hypothetical protein CYMTET_52614 [Cymbomonas tetramitiformis]